MLLWSPGGMGDRAISGSGPRSEKILPVRYLAACAVHMRAEGEGGRKRGE